MAHPTKSDSKRLAREQHRARLAAELRANLRKRKEQARNRSLRDAPESGEGSEPHAGEAPAGPGEEVA